MTTVVTFSRQLSGTPEIPVWGKAAMPHNNLRPTDTSVYPALAAATAAQTFEACFAGVTGRGVPGLMRRELNRIGAFIHATKTITRADWDAATIRFEAVPGVHESNYDCAERILELLRGRIAGKRAGSGVSRSKGYFAPVSAGDSCLTIRPITTGAAVSLFRLIVTAQADCRIVQTQLMARLVELGYRILDITLMPRFGINSKESVHSKILIETEIAESPVQTLSGSLAGALIEASLLGIHGVRFVSAAAESQDVAEPVATVEPEVPAEAPMPREAAVLLASESAKTGINVRLLYDVIRGGLEWSRENLAPAAAGPPTRAELPVTASYTEKLRFIEQRVRATPNSRESVA